MPHEHHQREITIANYNDKAASFNLDIDLAGYHEGFLWITCADKKASPTLDAKIQYTPDGVSFVDSAISYTQFTANGTQYKALTNFGKRIRLVVTMGGTGSFDVLVQWSGKRFE